MEKRTAVLLLVAMFLVPMGLISTIDEAEASPGTVFIGELKDGTEIISNADVYLEWSVAGESESVMWISESDELGKFEIVVPFTFDDLKVDGSTVTMTCKTFNYIRISEEIELDADTINYDDSTKTVNLGEIKSFPKKYIITKSISLEVFVGHNNVGIDNARVTIKNIDTGHVEETKTTNRAGYCNFDFVPGNYEITVERGGFVDWGPDPIELEKEAYVSKNVQLTPSPVATYWGFDLPHLLMMIGLTVALILTVSILLYMLKIRNNHEYIRVVDDSHDDDDFNDRR